MVDVSTEIKFQSARSGGKGGQNVNKVETMVVGYWQLSNSRMFTTEEKELIAKVLANRINAAGQLLVKSQTERTQLGNKGEVIRKMNELIRKSLVKPRKRKKTKPTAAAKIKRLEGKKSNGEIKQSRKKISI